MNGRELAHHFGQLANDCDQEAVLDAAMNLIRNALVQKYKKKADAIAHFNHLATWLGKELTFRHYDDKGDRKGVQPYNMAPDLLREFMKYDK